jgi:Recombinase zinc beta ribbon domain
VLVCGKCGLPMSTQTQGRRDGSRVPAYQCHPKLDPAACGGVSISPADEVEDVVVELMQARLARSAKLRRRLNASNDAETSRWRGVRDAAKGRMLEASALYGSGSIDRDSFTVMHDAAKLDHDGAQAKLDALGSDTILPSVEDVIERWDTLTLAQQRGVVEHVIERIVVAPVNGGPRSIYDRLGRPVWRT